jgi:hypothetical protein
MLCSQGTQPQRQLTPRQLAKAMDVGYIDRTRHTPSLFLSDPRVVLERKFVGLAPRPPSWNRHPYAPVQVHAHKVSPRAAVTDEIEIELRMTLWNRSIGS